MGVQQAVASRFLGSMAPTLHRSPEYPKHRLDQFAKQVDRGKLQEDLGKVFQMDQEADTPEAG